MARGKTRGRYGPGRGGDVSDDGGSDRWLGTYGDMVTLLMAFFVMLYAMSEVDAAKFAAFVEGLAVPFGNEAGEGLTPQAAGLLPDGVGLDPQEPAATSPQAPMIPDLPITPETPASADPPTTPGTGAAELLEESTAEPSRDDNLDEVSAVLTEALQRAGLDGLVEQRREERGLVVSIASDDVLFALGSTQIREQGREVIRTVARTLDGFPNPLLVEGHTDDLPLRRGSYTNWNLSTDRAVAVLSLMIEEHGLEPTNVAAAGYGEYRPLAENGTRAGRAKNRRVDIVVLVEQEIER